MRTLGLGVSDRDNRKDLIHCVAVCGLVFLRSGLPSANRSRKKRKLVSAQDVDSNRTGQRTSKFLELHSARSSNGKRSWTHQELRILHRAYWSSQSMKSGCIYQFRYTSAARVRPEPSLNDVNGNASQIRFSGQSEAPLSFSGSRVIGSYTDAEVCDISVKRNTIA